MGQAKAKRDRGELFDYVYYREFETLCQLGGPDLAGFYLVMRSYIKRDTGNEVPYTKEWLRKKLRCSNDKFYRLLRLAVRCGLITIKKVPGFEGRNRNVYIINPVPKAVVRGADVRRQSSKQSNPITDHNDVIAKLSAARQTFEQYKTVAKAEQQRLFSGDCGLWPRDGQEN